MIFRWSFSDVAFLTIHTHVYVFFFSSDNAMKIENFVCLGHCVWILWYTIPPRTKSLYNYQIHSLLLLFFCLDTILIKFRVDTLTIRIRETRILFSNIIGLSISILYGTCLLIQNKSFFFFFFFQIQASFRLSYTWFLSEN